MTSAAMRNREHASNLEQRAGSVGMSAPISGIKTPTLGLHSLDEYKPLIEAHAKYLQTTRTARMTIQGNADERGSREYNIALGQRRADTVKRMMLLYGATDTQIETVSFGKEKPKNSGHDEAAWTENRRDDVVYAGE